MRRMTRSVYSGFVASLGWSPTHSRRAGGPSCDARCAIFRVASVYCPRGVQRLCTGLHEATH